jgi:hypothetical protein
LLLFRAGGQGQDRTADLPLFRRLPTWDTTPAALVSQCAAVRPCPPMCAPVVTQLDTQSSQERSRITSARPPVPSASACIRLCLSAVHETLPRRNQTLIVVGIWCLCQVYRVRQDQAGRCILDAAVLLSLALSRGHRERPRVLEEGEENGRLFDAKIPGSNHVGLG